MGWGIAAIPNPSPTLCSPRSSHPRWRKWRGCRVCVSPPPSPVPLLQPAPSAARLHPLLGTGGSGRGQPGGTRGQTAGKEVLPVPGGDGDTKVTAGPAPCCHPSVPSPGTELPGTAVRGHREKSCHQDPRLVLSQPWWGWGCPQGTSVPALVPSCCVPPPGARGPLGKGTHPGALQARSGQQGTGLEEGGLHGSPSPHRPNPGSATSSSSSWERQQPLIPVPSGGIVRGQKGKRCVRPSTHCAPEPLRKHSPALALSAPGRGGETRGESRSRHAA